MVKILIDMDKKETEFLELCQSVIKCDNKRNVLSIILNCVMENSFHQIKELEQQKEVELLNNKEKYENEIKAIEKNILDKISLLLNQSIEFKNMLLEECIVFNKDARIAGNMLSNTPEQREIVEKLKYQSMSIRNHYNQHQQKYNEEIRQLKIMCPNIDFTIEDSA